MSEEVPVVDWTTILKYTESEIRCKCGAVFQSHAKGVRVGDRYRHVLRKPCPKCGSFMDAVRISSEPEQWSIG